MSVAWEENTAAINETQQFSVDPVTNLKVKTAVAGLQLSIQRYFLEFSTERDKELVADFLITCVQQENAAIRTKRVYLIALTYLSRHLENKKSFTDMTAQDLAAYLHTIQMGQLVWRYRTLTSRDAYTISNLLTS